jgi:hypothetical protein
VSIRYWYNVCIGLIFAKVMMLEEYQHLCWSAVTWCFWIFFPPIYSLCLCWWNLSISEWAFLSFKHLPESVLFDMLWCNILCFYVPDIHVYHSVRHLIADHLQQTTLRLLCDDTIVLWTGQKYAISAWSVSQWWWRCHWDGKKWWTFSYI